MPEVNLGTRILTSAQNIRGKATHTVRAIKQLGPANLAGIGMVVVLVLVGVIIVKDFGTSIDEYRQKLYADQMLDAYLGKFDPMATGSFKRFYGPFFSVLSTISTKLLVKWPLHLESYQAFHLSYYLAFVLGCIALYAVLLRYVGWLAATVGTLLFASQPVMFGHAFINPKDIPMMAFFAVSMTLGFYAAQGLESSAWVNHARYPNPGNSEKSHGHLIANPLAGTRGAVVLVVLIVTLVVSIADLAFTHVSLAWASRLLHLAYEDNAPFFVDALFRLIAQDAWKTPLSAYFPKLLSFYVFSGSAWISLLILAVVWAYARVALGIRLVDLVHRYRSWILLIVAAAALGMTVSIRVGGLFAGALIACLIVWSYDFRGAVVAALYGIVGWAVSVATWPFLWGDPVSRLVTSVWVMGDFPHETSVLFRGTNYNSTHLPWDYVAWLMLIQFTLPLFPLVCYGTFRAFAGRRFAAVQKREFAILCLWFLVPMGAYVILRPTLYGNFRQLLFISPPLFIMATLGFQGLWEFLRLPLLRALLLVAVLAPGLVGILRLHPYEYVYYNALVGGTRGAFQQYEMDYWCTSLREAALELNRFAGQGDEVAVLFRDTAQAAPFARPDLKVIHARTVNDILAIRPDEVLACSPGFNFKHADEWKTLAEVGREGATFSKVMDGPSR